MILVKSEGISSRTNLVYSVLEQNKFNYLKDESFSNQLWICLLKCLPGVVVVCVSGDLDDNDFNYFLSVRGRSAGSFSEQLLVIEPTKAATLFLLLFFFFLSDWAGKRRPPLLVLYICHIVCYTAFFFVVAQRFPLPPSLLSLWRLSRVGWQKEGVGSSGLPQERQDYYTFLLLPHP